MSRTQVLLCFYFLYFIKKIKISFQIIKSEEDVTKKKTEEEGDSVHASKQENN